jgi:hypothetical protein
VEVIRFDGVWRVACGVWRVACGVWRTHGHHVYSLCRNEFLVPPKIKICFWNLIICGAWDFSRSHAPGTMLRGRRDAKTSLGGLIYAEDNIADT